MKPLLQLVVLQQWKAYISIICMLLVVLFSLQWIQHTMNQVFSMPIAVQDLNDSAESQKIIKTIEAAPFVNVKEINRDEAYIEDVIKKKEAIVSLTIPEDFSEKLSKHQMREAIKLYYRDDFIGSIAQEIVSKSLYEIQVPYIVKKYVDKNEQISIKEAIGTYEKETPESKIKQFAANKAQSHSVSMNAIVSLILLFSSVQILLHKHIAQHAPLTRMFMFPSMRMKYHVVYIIVHVLILLMSIIGASILLQESMNITFYIICALLLCVYEFGLSAILIYIKTISHKMFMTVTFALTIVIIFNLIMFG